MGFHHFAISAGGNIVIDNCDITGWTSFASKITKVTITDTEFLEGNYNKLRFYQDSELNNVTFNPNMSIDFGKNEVQADFTDCSVTDGSALTDIIYLPDIPNMGVEVTIDDVPVIIEAKIGETYYMTLTEAIDKAVDNDVIVLLDTVKLDEAITIGKPVTIDLNGNTVEAKTNAFVIAAPVEMNNGTITGNPINSAKYVISINANFKATDVAIVSNNDKDAIRVQGTNLTAELISCDVTGGIYNTSTNAIVNISGDGVYTDEQNNLSGVAISGGTFYYEITDAQCAEGYTVATNTDAEGNIISWTVTGAPALTGSIRLKSGALNLLDKVAIIYECVDDTIVTNDADVSERGILLFDSAEKAATKDPTQAYEIVTLEWSDAKQAYRGQTEGIDARDMDKSQFAVAYLKMTDGTYIFGTYKGNDQVIEYSPLIYCKTKKDDPAVGNLCRAMMHYGAAAQVAQYGKTSGLMNEGFAAIPYDERVLGESVFSVDTAMINGMQLKSAIMDLKGAVSYIVEFSIDEKLEGKQLYAEYSLLSKTGYVPLVLHTNGRLRAIIDGVPAKDLGATLKVKSYYMDDNGEKVYGGELVYSGYEYVRRAVVNTSYSETVKDLSKALAMYIYYADNYGN